MMELTKNYCRYMQWNSRFTQSVDSKILNQIKSTVKHLSKITAIEAAEGNTFSSCKEQASKGRVFVKPYEKTQILS